MCACVCWYVLVHVCKDQRKISAGDVPQILPTFYLRQSLSVACTVVQLSSQAREPPGTSHSLSLIFFHRLCGSELRSSCMQGHPPSKRLLPFPVRWKRAPFGFPLSDYTLSSADSLPEPGRGLAALHVSPGAGWQMHLHSRDPCTEHLCPGWSEQRASAAHGEGRGVTGTGGGTGGVLLPLTPLVTI